MNQSNNISVRNNRLTILYLRLSREDSNHDGESNSIENQRTLLLDYAQSSEFVNIKIIIDDGLSGVTDDRKGFQEVISLVEQDLVDIVIVKDMSRFGRNYLLVGECIETTFPLHDIRLISVNERMDTKDGIDDFMPFIHIMDEYYSKGLSRKIRSSYFMKNKQGYALGHPPYGYVRNKENPKLWAIDEPSAEIVRYIFKLRMDGLGIEKIAEKLRSEKIYSPNMYAIISGKKVPKNKNTRGEYFWSHSVVSNILKNQSYVGDVVNNKTYSKSYKLKKRLNNPKENWTIHMDVHPAIAKRELWEQVQNKFSNSKYREPKYTEKSMFAGFLKCADCGKNLNHKHLVEAPQNDYFSCGANRRSKSLCPQTHHIRIDYLTEGVRQVLDRVVRFASDFEDEFVKIVCDGHYKQVCLTQELNKKKLSELLGRENQLDILFEKIYEDKVEGLLSEDRFKKLSYKYEGEQAELSVQLKEQQKIVDCEKGHELNVNQFLKMVRKYTQIHELNLHILNHFIKEIVVYHREELKESKTQRIDIHFNFIGEVILPSIEERRKYKKSFSRDKMKLSAGHASNRPTVVGRKKEDQIALAI